MSVVRSFSHSPDKASIEHDEARDRPTLPAEYAFEQSELVDLLPDAVFVHRGGLIVFANLAAVDLLGIGDRSELIGNRILDLLHPDDRDLAEPLIILNHFQKFDPVHSGHIQIENDHTGEWRFVRFGVSTFAPQIGE